MVRENPDSGLTGNGGVGSWWRGVGAPVLSREQNLKEGSMTKIVRRWEAFLSLGLVAAMLAEAQASGQGGAGGGAADLLLSESR